MKNEKETKGATPVHKPGRKNKRPDTTAHRIDWETAVDWKALAEFKKSLPKTKRKP
jgi:hypothetical protein